MVAGGGVFVLSFGMGNAKREALANFFYLVFFTCEVGLRRVRRMILSLNQ